MTALPPPTFWKQSSHWGFLWRARFCVCMCGTTWSPTVDFRSAECL